MHEERLCDHAVADLAAGAASGNLELHYPVFTHAALLNIRMIGAARIQAMKNLHGPFQNAVRRACKDRLRRTNAGALSFLRRLMMQAIVEERAFCKWRQCLRPGQNGQIGKRLDNDNQHVGAAESADSFEVFRAEAPAI